MPVEICQFVSTRNVSLSPPSNRSSANQLTELVILCVSSFIFLVALVGNLAALIVMFGPRGFSRLNNGRYLTNLALADSLRTLLIPFTIIPRIKRNFIFGSTMCQLLPVAQGLSVSVGALTLVSISMERYFAICRPLLLLELRSNRYSSSVHTFNVAAIWLFSLLTALPNIQMYRLCFLPTMRRFKCEKSELRYLDGRVYIIFLDIFYLLMPMAVMIILHASIILRISRNDTAMKMKSLQMRPRRRNPFNDMSTTLTEEQKQSLPFAAFSRRGREMNSSLICRLDRQRRRALKLLIVLIIEFFICWTPIYLYHTLSTFDKTFHRSMPPFLVTINLFLSFASAACNPITYYFMSRRYRSMLYKNIKTLCCG